MQGADAADDMGLMGSGAAAEADSLANAAGAAASEAAAAAGAGNMLQAGIDSAATVVSGATMPTDSEDMRAVHDQPAVAAITAGNRTRGAGRPQARQGRRLTRASG